MKIWHSNDVGPSSETFVKSSMYSILFSVVYRSALHLACARGHSKVVETLLEWTNRVNICDSDKRTPLMKVIERSNLLK